MYFKKSLYFFCIGIFCILACKQDNKSSKSLKINDKTTNGDIVMIFDQAPENWKLVKKGGYIANGKHEIEYSKDGITPIYWSPDYAKEKDTLIIQDFGRNLEIIHKYKGIDEFNYILKPKDTVVFTYNDLMPCINILNRKVKKYDGNFDVLKRKLIATEDFPNALKYNTPMMFFMENPAELTKEMEQEMKYNHKIKAKNELIEEKKLLDSLLVNSLMSKEIYDFYNLRNIFLKKMMEPSEKTIKSDSNQLTSKGDELVNFSFYKDYLQSIVREKFVDGQTLVKFSNALIPDYRTVYDSINSNNSFSKREKEYLSFIYLENIINNFSNSDINRYLQHFNNDYSKSTSLNYIMAKHNLTGNMSRSLDIKNQNNIKFNLLEIIEKNKGKILYIDFWASWCAPCRKTMPAAKILRDDFKDTNIVFIYLAIYDKTKEWEKASFEEGLDSYEHNYIVENSKSSKFVDDLKLFSIPRYIIYNEEGKLIHTNAPGPDSQEIRKLFNLIIE